VRESGEGESGFVHLVNGFSSEFAPCVAHKSLDVSNSLTYDSISVI